MDELSLAALKPGEPLTSSLHHRTGTILLPRGPCLTPAGSRRSQGRQHPPALRPRPIPPTSPSSKNAPASTHSPSTPSRSTTRFPQDICNDHGVILLSRNHIFHAEYGNALIRCNIKQVWTTSGESLRELDAFILARSKGAADALDNELDAAPPMLNTPLDHPPFLERLTRLIHRTPELRSEITNLRTGLLQPCPSPPSPPHMRPAPCVKADIHEIVDHVIVGFTRDSNFLLKLSVFIQQATR